MDRTSIVLASLLNAADYAITKAACSMYYCAELNPWILGPIGPLKLAVAPAFLLIVYYLEKRGAALRNTTKITALIMATLFFAAAVNNILLTTGTQ